MKNKLDVLEIKYEPEDDVMNVFFSKEKIDNAFDVEPKAIMHVDKSDNPVYLEIFEASKRFNTSLKNLPEKIKQSYLASV